MIPNVPVTSSRLKDWMRAIANAINALIRETVQKDGADIYAAPTISNPPTQSEVQSIADALAIVSSRLKG